MKLKEEFRNLSIPVDARYINNGFYFDDSRRHVWIEKAWFKVSDLNNYYTPAYKSSKDLSSDHSLYEEEPTDQEPEIKEVTKPEIGLMPKYIWLEIRRDEIILAIARYIEANRTPLPEWYEELKSILCKIEFDKKTGE